MSLARNLRLKHYFNSQDQDNSKSNSVEPSLAKFAPPSDFDPPPLPADHPIEQYINFLVQNISDPTFENNVTSTTLHNLTEAEKKAISTLKSNTDIMILPADKGSTTVIMNKSDYVSEIQRQLSDSSTYLLLKEDPTIKYTAELKEIIYKHSKSNNISPETTNLLIPEEPICPKIYILPKIHKGITPPPGRPIVSGCGSLTERISSYVDAYLQPLVQNLASYIKDSNDFLQKLNNVRQPLPANTLMATIDVTSLYTNIPHVHGLTATENYLQNRPKGSLPTTSFITQLIKFILEKNYFQFQDKHFLQIKGTAMGTRMAPSYANLYMGNYEEKFLSSREHLPICWFRYIDDIFIIWTHGEESLRKFLEDLNSFGPLNFTWDFSETSINFLDLTIHLRNNSLTTSIHIKPTNHQQYLHFSSCHPNNTKRSLPYSLALRGNRLISEPKDRTQYQTQLQKAFENRGYPSTLVKSQIQAAQNPRPTTKKNTNHLQVNLITTYHPGLQQLNNLLKTGFKILESSSQTKNLLSRAPSIIYRQPPNLRNMLVHPKLPNPSKIPSEKPRPGSYPCNENRCKSCQIHHPTETFTSTYHNKNYRIQGHHTCSSENLIYQLQCSHCPAQYIGLTTETLRKRMNGHRHDVKTSKEKPVAQHALSHQLLFDECFTIKALKSLPKNQCNSSMLRRWELAYQFVTNSRTPPNLNIR
ncbi:uncharacterized protein LOC128992830 [Macrosteles quadrilineatus]|uniref:uncharacterized protein LOC128992830 n=1 Tax=Macrosteles quadrilineatus TaxID=74068 RepID=UPI0023E17480|nr:uncharacterized protein LOC128992830 [Macrosteles quadrilineatus]